MTAYGAPGSRLYYAREVRELDRLAIEEYAIPGFTLMQRAGTAAFLVLREHWPDADTLEVFCGSGNNGGDGYIVAGLAMEQGLHSRTVYLGDPGRLQGSARRAREYARLMGVPMAPFHCAWKPGHGEAVNTVLVDALLGTGLTGEVRAPYRQAIEAINAAGLPVLAIDIPSGLCSDTGASLGATVRATVTVSFIGLKIGTVTGRGPEFCGKLVYRDLGVPPAIHARVTPAGTLQDKPPSGE